MLRSLRVLSRCGLAGVLVIVLGFSLTAFAQTETQDEDESNAAGGTGKGWGVFAGYLEGGEVTNESIMGFRPELDDGPSFGALYYLQTTDIWTIELRVGIGVTEMLDTFEDVDGTINETTQDTTLYYIEVALKPSWRKGNFEYAIPFGLGWAWTDAEDAFTTELVDRPGLDDSVEDGDGYVIFAGFQARWHLRKGWSIFAEARVHRFQDLVNIVEQEVVSPELTIGFMKEL